MLTGVVILGLSLVACRPLFTRRTGYAWDLALLVVCVPIVRDAGVWDSLAPQWKWLPAYLLIAVLTFMLSVLLTTPEPRRYLQGVASAWCTAAPHRHLSWALLATATACYEEAVWRVVIQSLLILVLPALGAVALTSLLFTVWHRRRTGTNVRLGVELFCFSMVVGGLLFATNDPLAAIVPHLLRNHLVSVAAYAHG